MHHPHLHCVVPGGGLSLDGQSWVPCRRSRQRRREFFLPVRILSRVFRGKFIAGLKTLFRTDKLKFFGKLQPLAHCVAFEQLLNQAVRRDWVVYAKRPFGGPPQVLKYLARYTHRVAISNQRLLNIDNERVTFQYKDYADHSQTKIMSLNGTEFLRRFLMHVLPRGFVRIRHYGFLANRYRGDNLSLCRKLLGVSESTPSDSLASDSPQPANMMASEPELPCPVCKTGKLLRIESFPAVGLTVIPAPHLRPPSSETTKSARGFGPRLVPTVLTTPGTNTS